MLKAKERGPPLPLFTNFPTTTPCLLKQMQVDNKAPTTTPQNSHASKFHPNCVGPPGGQNVQSTTPWHCSHPGGWQSWFVVLEPMFPPGGEFHNGCGTLRSRLEKESPDHNFGSLLLSHCMPTCLQSHHHLPCQATQLICNCNQGLNTTQNNPTPSPSLTPKLYIYKWVAGAITKCCQQVGTWNQCWAAILHFYEEPPVPILKENLGLFQFWVRFLKTNILLLVWEFRPSSSLVSGNLDYN